MVIAPLNAMRQDFQDLCDRLGIRCAMWCGTDPPYDASIVLTTPESVVSSSFGRFLNQKRMLCQLDRIVIDECHVLLESTATWRPAVLELCDMTKKNTQVVYLTATLPPTLEPAFLQAAELQGQPLKVCRDPHTARTNIAYQVIDYESATRDETLKRLVATKQQEFGPDAQIIVYCLSVSLTMEIANLLSCAAYYSAMGTEEEKANCVRAFAAGIVKLCTAINMLGLGLHAPGVRVVIHLKMPLLLHHYVKESGRAGRTGLPSESIVLRQCWQTPAGDTRRSLPYKLDAPSKAFLTGEQCRRIAIDQHMDGRQDREHCSVGEARCDLCTVHPHGTKRRTPPVSDTEASALARAVERQQREIECQLQSRRANRRKILENLQQYIQKWASVCPICMAATGMAISYRPEICKRADSTLFR